MKLPAGPPRVAKTSAVFAVVKPEGAALVDAMSNVSPSCPNADPSKSPLPGFRHHPNGLFGLNSKDLASKFRKLRDTEFFVRRILSANVPHSDDRHGQPV